MNGQTAKLIRKVASARGKNNPKYVRSLKRKYNALSREDRELQKIQWRVEVDDFLDEIEKEYAGRVAEKQKRVERLKASAGSYEEELNQALQQFRDLRKTIESATFVKRFGYMMTGEMEGVE